MRTVRSSAFLAALAFALVPACRGIEVNGGESASPAASPSTHEQSAGTSRDRSAEPSRGSSATTGTNAASSSVDARPAGSGAPAAQTAATGPGSKQREPSAPDTRPAPTAKNRDKLGPRDVAQYIENLQSASRVAELRVDTVLEKLALPEDAFVGDLGCGPGVFTFAFAKACPDGVVFASDIEPAQLDVVRQRIRETNRRNVVPVLASEDDAHFPPGLLDVVFVADTYHHIENRVPYLRRLGKALKPGGRLVVLDYKPGPLPIGPPPEHKLAAGVMHKELVEGGWKLVERFDTHPHHDFEVWRLVQPWER